MVGNYSPETVVTLPTGLARRHELLHELAWIHLLSTGGHNGVHDGSITVNLSVEGREAPQAEGSPEPASNALEALLAHVLTATPNAGSSQHGPAALAAGALVTTEGWCGSDLFV